MEVLNLISLSILLLAALPGSTSEKGHNTPLLPKGVTRDTAKGSVAAAGVIEKRLHDEDAVDITDHNKSKVPPHGGDTVRPFTSKILQHGINSKKLFDEVSDDYHRSSVEYMEPGISERILVCHPNHGKLDKVFVNLYEIVTFVSPKYPSHYPHNLACGWQILTKVHNKLYFSCSKVEVAEGDYLTLQSGGYSRNFSKYSNNMMHYTMDKPLNLTFVSDAVDASEGFVCSVEVAVSSEHGEYPDENFSEEDQIFDDSHEAPEEHGVPCRGTTCSPLSHKSEKFNRNESKSQQQPNNEGDAKWFDKIFGQFQYEESDFNDSFSDRPFESDYSYERYYSKHRPHSSPTDQRRVSRSIETHTTMERVSRTMDDSIVRNLTITIKERNFKKQTNTTELHNPITGKFDSWQNSTESKKNKDSFSYNETVY